MQALRDCLPVVFTAFLTRSLPFQGSERFGTCGLGRTDIEVTGEQVSGLQLQVRRGSEPALNQLPEGLDRGLDRQPSATLPPPCQRKAASKRWSAAPIIMETSETSPMSKATTNGHVGSPLGSPGSLVWEDEERDPQPLQRDAQRESQVHLRPPAYGRFSRDGSNRLSMQFLGESAG